MNRLLTRILLSTSLFAAIAVAILAVLSAGPSSKEAWAIVAASLAVITSVISSWSSQRVLEQQEDAQKPYVLPTIDNKSRLGLLLLRLKNTGGGPAYDIYIEWEIPLLNAKGEIVQFNDSGDGGPEISVLLPQESLAILIDGHVDYFGKYPQGSHNYTGIVKYRDVSGKKIAQKFRVNERQIAKTLVHDVEETKAFRKVQDLPSSIDKLTSEVRSLRFFVEDKFGQTDDDDE